MLSYSNLHGCSETRSIFSAFYLLDDFQFFRLSYLFLLCQKDLGILFDHQLKFHLHTTDVAAKANRLLELIRRCFDHLNLDMLLFVTVVCPMLEYCSSVWGPSLGLDQRKKGSA